MWDTKGVRCGNMASGRVEMTEFERTAVYLSHTHKRILCLTIVLLILLQSPCYESSVSRSEADTCWLVGLSAIHTVL